MSPNDAPWETLSLRLSRPISAPLLTVARSWRHEEEDLLTTWVIILKVALLRRLFQGQHYQPAV